MDDKFFQNLRKFVRLIIAQYSETFLPQRIQENLEAQHQREPEFSILEPSYFTDGGLFQGNRFYFDEDICDEFMRQEITPRLRDNLEMPDLPKDGNMYGCFNVGRELSRRLQRRQDQHQVR